MAVGSADRLTALAPLAEHRRAGGYEVILTESSDAAEALRSQALPPDYLLLLGNEKELPPKAMPYYRWDTKKQPPAFPSDMVRADLNADGVADFPVGRLPYSDPDQIRAAALKTIAWEKRTPQPGDLSLPIWAGDPNFGPAAKILCNQVFFNAVTRHPPPWLDFWILYGEAGHALGGWVQDHPATYASRLRQGALLSGMNGHGHPDHFWSLTHEQQRICWRSTDAARLQNGPPLAPHVIIACSCAAFHRGTGPCVAESLVSTPGGPVVCVAATEMSHPLPNYYSGICALRALADTSLRTAGDFWLAVQRMAYAERDTMLETVLRDLERAIHGEKDFTRLRQDHQFLYNIIGDPAARMFIPQPLEVKITPVAEKADAPRLWTVSRPADVRGPLHVEFRRKITMPEAAPAAETRAAAEKRFLEAQQALAFQPLREIPGTDAWEGHLPEGPGTLRFYTLGADGWLVAGIAMP